MRRTFACSDLHGIWSLYEQMNKFIQPGDTVFFLGDAADRGPDGWKIIRSLASNPQWIYLKGNHEDMLAKAMAEQAEGLYAEDCFLLAQNGGHKTLQDWMADGGDEDWIHFLNNLPIRKTFINEDGVNIELCHAGFTPFKDAEPSEYQLLWNRNHLKTPRRELWKDNTIVVHGHTPIQYLAGELNYVPGAFWLNEQKVCIDNGSFASGFGCLFDLDTYDEHIFHI